MVLLERTVQAGAKAESASVTAFRVWPLLDRLQKVGRLRFAPMQIDSTEILNRLVDIYNSAWSNEGQLRQNGFSEEEIAQAKGLYITRQQLQRQHESFPEGQMVVWQRMRNGTGKVEEVPVALLSTVPWAIQRTEDIPTTYDAVTTYRMFTKNQILPPEVLWDDPAIANMLFCVSIAVDPAFQGRDIAQDTLNFAIGFAQERQLVAAPYSAPRDYGAYLKRHPGTTIEGYLQCTKPGKGSYRDYQRHVAALNRRELVRATYGRPLEPLPKAEWERIHEEETGDRAYRRFRNICSEWFQKRYGWEPTVVDYIRLSGRRHYDRTMNLHIGNGADFLYDDRGNITAVFPNSRPEDVQAAGYNIVLVYNPHPLFGHSAKP